MTLLLQLVAVWSLLSVLVAVGCALLFKGADAYAARAVALPPADESRLRAPSGALHA